MASKILFTETITFKLETNPSLEDFEYVYAKTIIYITLNTFVKWNGAVHALFPDDLWV
jgi:hypothetical protein